MSNNEPVNPKKPNIPWKSIALTAFIGFMVYKGLENNQLTPEISAKNAAEQVRQRGIEEQVALRRETGFVEVRKYANAFDEVTGMDYTIIGKNVGSNMLIEKDEKGTVKRLCFRAITQNDKKVLFTPYNSVTVYAKFDGGETKSFSATRGMGGDYLCITSLNRFMYNLKSAQSLAIALPFIEYSEHVTEVHEFNLKTYNGMIK